MTITTCIFDLDGLLSDTERLHLRAYQEVMGDMGITVSDHVYLEHWVRQGRGIDDYLREWSLDADADLIRERKAVRYRELVRSEVQPMPGAVDLLERLQGRKMVALASSAYPDAVDTVVDTLGIRKFFKVIVSRGNVERVKPFPDIFLFAAKALGVVPAECVVLEDAEKGIIAACDAGMACIAVPTEFTAGNDFSRATRVVASLCEVSLKMIDDLSGKDQSE